MLTYYSIDEIAQKAGLTRDQVFRLGFTGALVFSILDHSPRNYADVYEMVDEDGSKTRCTRTSETVTFASSEETPLKLNYISPEDTINIIANDAPNRWTLIRATYKTRDIDPKKGVWRLNSPKRVTPADLVVSLEEWEHFAQGPGKAIKHYLPLALPERVTLPWLFINMPIKTWIQVIGIASAVFVSGIYFAQTDAYMKLNDLFKVAAKEKQ